VNVLVLADDLIWSTRLVAQVRAAGADATGIRTLTAFEAGLAAADAAIVDLTARAYDGIEAIMLAAAAGTRVLAVGQHDDVQLRKRALAAGAERVHPYRKLFDDGPATLAKWLNPVVEASAR
jgi:DNA-binding response OmpR family regulator